MIRLRVGSFIGAALLLAALLGAKPAETHSKEKPTQKRNPPVKPDPELAALQGMWEYRLTKSGRQIHAVKEIRGKRETVSIYLVADGKETLYSRWHVDFTVRKTAQVRIFTYRNMTYTHGPHKGETIHRATSYLYQVRGNHLIAIFGYLNSDNRPPYGEVWLRPKPQI